MLAYLIIQFIMSLGGYLPYFSNLFKFHETPMNNWCAIFVVRTIKLGVSVFCKLFFSPLILYFIGSQ